LDFGFLSVAAAGNAGIFFVKNEKSFSQKKKKPISFLYMFLKNIFKF